MKKNAPWLPRLGAWLGASCIVLALIAWGLVEYSRIESEAYRAELEKRGEEFSVEKLVAARSRNQKDASELFAAMQALCTATQPKKFPIPWGGQKDSGQAGSALAVHRLPSFQHAGREISWPEIQREMAALEKPLADVRAAAAIPDRIFTYDYTLGPGPPPSFVTPCFRTCQWLGRENLVLLHEGRIEDSVANIEAMLSIVRKLHEQTILISQLVGHSVLSIASASTWEILAANPDEENLRRLAAAWETIDVTSSFPATVRMERCWGLNGLRSDVGTLWKSTRAMTALTSSFPSGPPPSRFQDLIDNGLLFVTFSLWSTFFRYADERQLLEYFQMLLDSREQNEDWNTLLAKSSAVEAKLGFGHFFSRTTIPGLKSSLERIALVDTIQKLTATAIALRRFALAHGNALPATLEELVPHYLPAVPLDPMDLQPIRYRRTADGCLLYGIGPNGKDEGGNPSRAPGKRANSWNDGLDIVWPQVAP